MINDMYLKNTVNEMDFEYVKTFKMMAVEGQPSKVLDISWDTCTCSTNTVVVPTI
jgi:hypothetical protein